MAPGSGGKLATAWISIAYMVSKLVRTSKFGMFPSNLLKLRSLQKEKSDVIRKQESKLNNCPSQHG